MEKKKENGGNRSEANLISSQKRGLDDLYMSHPDPLTLNLEEWKRKRNKEEQKKELKQRRDMKTERKKYEWKEKWNEERKERGKRRRLKE